ncbi:vesicle-associated membrane protein 7-like [Ciona intestinalis]|nr:vesicle-associated membrane protein 711-like [Ciona intestinalis]|eukprot:XP_026694821.1 vesicle-associated membrane protein 711-like [Ciona intestinalis]
MPILYSCISRGNVILVDKTIGPGDHQFHAQGFLTDLPTVGVRKTTLPHDDVLYHTMTDNGLVYLCAADKEFGRRIPYLFLEELKKQFCSSGSLLQRTTGASAFEFNRDFRNILSGIMDDFNKGKGDQLSTMQNQVGEVTGIMRQNIEKVIERGDKLDDLVDKTEDLQAGAATFKVTAKRIQRKYFWQNKKMLIIIIVIVLIIITLIVLFATGTI